MWKVASKNKNSNCENLTYQETRSNQLSIMNKIKLLRKKKCAFWSRLRGTTRKKIYSYGSYKLLSAPLKNLSHTFTSKFLSKILISPIMMESESISHSFVSNTLTFMSLRKIHSFSLRKIILCFLLSKVAMVVYLSLSQHKIKVILISQSFLNKWKIVKFAK